MISLELFEVALCRGLSAASDGRYLSHPQPELLSLAFRLVRSLGRGDAATSCDTVIPRELLRTWHRVSAKED